MTHYNFRSMCQALIRVPAKLSSIECVTRTLLLPLLATISFPALAHHSLAHFDIGKVVEKRVVITAYRFVYPHPVIEGLEATESGYQAWQFEVEGTSSLAEVGWTEDSLRVGELVTIFGNPLVTPTREQMFLNFVQKENEEWLISTPRTFDSYVENSSESPDGHMDLSEQVGLFGTWIRVDVPDIELTNLPLTHNARLLVNRFDARLDPVQFCAPIGFPRMMVEPYGLRISQTNDRSIEIEKELVGSRFISLQQEEIGSESATRFGRSFGQFVSNLDENKQVFVVESSSIEAQEWGTLAGLDSGSDMKVTERFFLSNNNAELTIQMTVDDDEHFSEPAHFEVYYKRVEDYSFNKNPCAS